MSKRRIHSQQAPKPGGPYSQAVESDGWIYVAGQVPIDPETGEWVTGGIAEQTERVLKNIAAVLEAAGATMKNVMKTTVYLSDLGEFAQMNEVYGDFFDDACPPARATIEAKGLPGGCKVEIDAVAKV